MLEPTRQDQPPESGPCFHGSYPRAVDGKGRFNLPFRFRRSGSAAGDERYVACEGPDGLLTLFPYGEWLRTFERLRQGPGSPERRAQLRRLSHASRVLEPDEQGRVTIPQEFLAPAEIQGRVLVVGMGHYMELWDPERFARTQEAAPAPDPGFTEGFYA